METGKGQDACKREITTHNPVSEKNETLDSYERFLTTFGISKENLYKFGLEETILPEIDDIDKMWRELKDKIYDNRIVFIRGAGRDAKGTQIYLDFYKELFQNDSIEKDPTNNLRPQKIIQDLTGYRRNQNIYNYQVSHIFGRTKNPLLFEAPWNIAFVPKLIDPFTGHETKGIWPEEYQKLFLEKIRLRYDRYIQDYNAIIEGLKIDEAINKFQLKNNKYESKEMEQFIKGIKVELSVI